MIPPRLLLAFSFFAVGCASAPSAPRCVGTSEPVLTAHAEESGAGKIRLRVDREWTREMERDASAGWVTRVADSNSRPIPVDPPGRVGVADGRPGLPLLPSDVLAPLFEWIAWLFGPGRGVSPGPVARFAVPMSEPVLTATVEPAGGGTAINLGTQPLDGYVLDLPLLRQLGGPGAEIVVRDRLLSTSVRLPEPR